MRMLITQTLKVAAKRLKLRLLTVNTSVVQCSCIFLTMKVKTTKCKETNTKIGGV